MEDALDPRGGHNRYSYNQNFFKKWSFEMAYVLGFIFADGNVTDAAISSRTAYLHITNKDKEILEKIKCVMNSGHPITESREKLLKYPNGWYRGGGTSRFRIGSKILCSDLKKLGVIPNKSKILRLPEIPQIFFMDFVRGYFDGDGCVYIEKKDSLVGKKIRRIRVIFTSGSRNFLEDLSCAINRHILIEGSIYEKARSFQLVYYTKGSNALYKHMYKNAEELCITRKKKKFEEYLESRRLGENCVR
jgi:hypothetical protein